MAGRRVHLEIDVEMDDVDLRARHRARRLARPLAGRLGLNTDIDGMWASGEVPVTAATEMLADTWN